MSNIWTDLRLTAQVRHRFLSTVVPFMITVLAILLAGCGDRGDAVVSIALHPTNPNIIYVATNEALFKTRDGGRNWERFPAFSARRVTAVTLDPQLPATVYAGTMGDAVYKSPDGGQHWLPHNVGLKEHVSYVNQFAFHPQQTETLYVATTVGVFRSTDGGRIWEEQMAGMKEVHIVVTIAIDPKDPRTLYAGTTGGAYRSFNGAATWQKINNGLIPAHILEASLSLGVNSLAVDPEHTATLYAGTTKGLFKSTDRGDTWIRIGQTLGDQYISSLAIDPRTPKVLYAGGRAGIQKTADGGQTWQVTNAGLATTNIRAIAISPLDSNAVYVGTNGSGLYRSADGAKTWTHIPLTPASQAHLVGA